jgi:hypothetical protein
MKVKLENDICNCVSSRIICSRVNYAFASEYCDCILLVIMYM